jgi:hypothetical protein
MTRKWSDKEVENEVLLEEIRVGLATGQYKTAHHAAKETGFPRSLLYARLKVRLPRTQAHRNEQHLSEPEESALAQWIQESTATGYLPRYPIVRDMAEEIRIRRVASINTPTSEDISYQPLGEQWVQRFLQRHPTLKSVISSQIESQRLSDVSKQKVNQFFDALITEMERHNITWENVYNMDKTGNALGTVEAARVIVDSTLQTRYQAPLIIFKGENINTQWVPPGLPGDWKWACNTKGWTSNIHGVEWLRRCFEPATREKANGRWRLLICDGHDSHISGNFIYHCRQYKITLLLLPPHSSHLLQPLDIGLFGPLKKAISFQMDKLLVARFQKAEWAECYAAARNSAFTPQNIRGGWGGAGIFPIDRVKILDRIRIGGSATPSLAPSTPTMVDDIRALFDTSLITSLPPDIPSLRRTSSALVNHLEEGNTLNTPMRKWIPGLTMHTERAYAKLTLSQKDNKDKESVLSARKIREGGKRAVLKDVNVATGDEIYEKIKDAEKMTNEKKRKKSVSKSIESRKRPPPVVESSVMSLKTCRRQGYAWFMIVLL